MSANKIIILTFTLTFHVELSLQIKTEKFIVLPEGLSIELNFLTEPNYPDSQKTMTQCSLFCTLNDGCGGFQFDSSATCRLFQVSENKSKGDTLKDVEKPSDDLFVNVKILETFGTSDGLATSSTTTITNTGTINDFTSVDSVGGAVTLTTTVTTTLATMGPVVSNTVPTPTRLCGLWQLGMAGVQTEGAVYENLGPNHTKDSCVQACASMPYQVNAVDMQVENGDCFCWQNLTVLQSEPTFDVIFLLSCN